MQAYTQSGETNPDWSIQTLVIMLYVLSWFCHWELLGVEVSPSITISTTWRHMPFQGITSSSASVVDRIEDLLPGLLNEKSDYNMEAEMSAYGSKLNINYKVARLGNRSSSGLQLQVALVKNFGMSHANRVVQFVNYPVFETISRTNAGEYAEGNLSFDLSAIDNLPDTAVFKIVQENSIKVLFTMKKEIEW